MAYGLSEINQNGVDYRLNDPNITDEFSTSKAYSVGEYVNYNGLLYQFNIAHPAGVWNASHVTEVKIGDEITDLNSILNKSASDTILSVSWKQGAIRSSDGAATGTASNRIRVAEFTFAPAAFKVMLGTGMKATVFQYADASTTGYKQYWGWLTGEQVFSGGYYYRVCAAHTDDSAILPDSGSGVTITAYNWTDTTLSRDGKAADAKVTGDALSNLNSAIQDDWFLTNTPGISWERGNITTAGTNTGTTNNYVIRTAGFLPCEESVLLKLDLSNLASTNICFAYFYNDDQAMITRSRVSLINPLGVTPPEGTAYCRITFGYTSESGIIIDDVGTESKKCIVKLLYGLNRKVSDIYHNFAVTPQMFGAIADGVNDDTDAFQAALNSGKNVFVPTNNHEKYRITRTLTIPSTCKIIYGTGQWRTAATYGGYIRFDLTPRHDAGSTINDLRTYSLFELDMAGSVMIQGLKFVCEKVLTTSNNKWNRVGYFVSGANVEKVDYDFRLENVQVGGFYRCIRLLGRGCEVYNSQFNSINCLATFTWDHDTNNNHPEGTGQRAIVFKNNRIHSVGSFFIKVLSGHAYGFTFVNNTIDNGKGQLIIANEKAKNWLIADNIVQGMENNQPVMLFSGGAENCIISNNVFSADLGYWYGRQTSPPFWLYIGGESRGVTVSSNTFRNSASSMIIINNGNGIAITSNIFDSPSLNDNSSINYDDENNNDEEPDESAVVFAYYTSAIRILSGITKSTICGNVCISDINSIKLLSAPQNVSLDGVTQMGNNPNE